MKKIIFVTTIFLIIMLIGACSFFNSPKEQKSKLQNQNDEKSTGTLRGKVKIFTGDCMPRTAEDTNPNTCSSKGMPTTVFIRKIADEKNIDKSRYPEALNEKSKPELVKIATSEADGTYQVELPEGDYSVFIEYEGREVCSLTSNKGYCVVDVKKGQATEFNPEINLAAQ